LSLPSYEHSSTPLLLALIPPPLPFFISPKHSIAPSPTKVSPPTITTQKAVLEETLGQIDPAVTRFKDAYFDLKDQMVSKCVCVHRSQK
jgi:hypothetical protein